MVAIIRVESKRIIKSLITAAFIAVVLLLSINSSYQAVKSYELWNRNGFVASGAENLKHAKENAVGMEIEQAIAALRETGNPVFADETNIKMLVNMNYPDKAVEELSNEEINLFLENRLQRISHKLEENNRFTYTAEEKECFMKRAEKIDSLVIGYAEGWKVLNRDMGNFLPIVLIMISLLLMPLFADDTQNKMKELSRSAKYGKKQLALARFLSAFLIGSAFYLLAVLCFFFIKMFPFGFAGSGYLIQSNADTFLSVFPITYLEQFMITCLCGYIALIFEIAMTILVSVTTERIMIGSVVICFFWLLLLVMEQMMQFEVNHWLANFLPLRLSGNADFFTSNEIYRFAGNSFDAIVWCPVIVVASSAVMLILSIIWLTKERLTAKIHGKLNHV